LRQDPLAFRRGRNQSAGFAELSGLYREAGLAAVAVELNLHVLELAPEVAEAIERGAAALFLAGYSPYSTLTRQRAGLAEEGLKRKAPRAARYPIKTMFKAPKEPRRSAIAGI
jgi:hypothetical protein